MSSKTSKQFTWRKCTDKEFCCVHLFKKLLSLLCFGYLIHRNYNVKYENNGNLTEVNASGSVPLALTSLMFTWNILIIFRKNNNFPPYFTVLDLRRSTSYPLPNPRLLILGYFLFCFSQQFIVAYKRTQAEVQRTFTFQRTVYAVQTLIMIWCRIQYRQYSALKLQI